MQFDQNFLQTKLLGSSKYLILSTTSNSYTTFSFILIVLMLLIIGYKKRVKNRDDKLHSKEEMELLKTLQGPKPFPIIGSLHHLGQDDIPFAGFTRLKKTFGNIFSIRLGNTDCVVVNNTTLRDEVLLSKSNDFDGRPQFERFRLLFGGDKQNALAFCDFDDMQSLRRDILSNFTFPHSFSDRWENLDEICQIECHEMIKFINQEYEKSNGQPIDIKMIVMKACANIFNCYFCATDRMDYTDPIFDEYVVNFDAIFFEVNTGRLPDFAPWLIFLSAWPIFKIKRCAKTVRKFVTEIVNNRTAQISAGTEGRKVFLDSLLPYISDDDLSANKMDKEKAMYALDDILGGHCAVGCMAIRILDDIARNPESQSKIQSEYDKVKKDDYTFTPTYAFKYAEKLHWSRAAMFETVRLTCSPIVPHRATKDSSIGGYFVKKDTVIFVNNHELSMSEEYWTEGETHLYKPERFLKYIQDGDDTKVQFMRPGHFKPFSHGKRSCMGYKLVESVSLALVVAIVNNFEISLPNKKALKIPKGMLGLPDEKVLMHFKKRNIVEGHP